MAHLVPCPACAAFHRSTETTCPHCGAAPGPTLSATAIALLAGLTLAGCDIMPVSKYGVAPDYGVTDTSDLVDADGDGFSVDEGDCDDDAAAIHPDAAEVVGDGIDSNCNDEDDT